MRTTIKYFRNSFLVTIVGLGLGAFLGWETTGNWVGALSTMFVVAVLAILEVSLSFDNAVVNATVLKEMTPVWRRRFITWGIAIAVFGMRIVFPLAIVAIIAGIDPFSALVMAATDPDRYSHVLTSATSPSRLSEARFSPWSASTTFSIIKKTCTGSPLSNAPNAPRADRGGGTGAGTVTALDGFHLAIGA